MTFNSLKWIPNCLESIGKSKYPSEKISIIIVDNGSQDGINDFIKSYNHYFGSVKFIINNKNEGFGKANNIGAKNAISNCLMFLNPDTELQEDALKELMKHFENDDRNIAIWELRQFPYEHPKYYNPITLETTWSSAAAFMIRKPYFDEIRGFDKNIYMYCEDVDLSWRLRINGYVLKYVPKAVVYHYSYADSKIKPVQFYNSIKYNILLRYKFGSIRNILAGYFYLVKLILGNEQFRGSRSKLIKLFLFHFYRIPSFLIWRFKNWRKIYTFNKKFIGWDFELRRDGVFYINELPETKPLVSVIVRTIGRPTILKEALNSIKNQTYDNIETVVIEDGPSISKYTIDNEYKDLNIQYFSNEKRLGRCKAGNIGLEKAKGEYIIFLDDDDIFFSDHLEVLVNNLEKNKKFLAAYSISFETPIIVKSIDPYVYKELSYDVIYRQPFNRLLLFHHNYIPIQTIMFSRKLYKEIGGFDENLDLMEDWDLWVRYSLKTDFLFVPKCTSIYRVPGDKKEGNDRHLKLLAALKSVRQKHSNLVTCSRVNELTSELEAILNPSPVTFPETALQKIPFATFFIKILKNLYR